jgi:hypothetical protein
LTNGKGSVHDVPRALPKPSGPQGVPGARVAPASPEPDLEQLVAAAHAATAPKPATAPAAAPTAAGAAKRDARAQEALRDFMARKKAKMDALLRDEREGRGRELEGRRAAVRDMAQRQREVRGGSLLCSRAGMINQGAGPDVLLPSTGHPLTAGMQQHVRRILLG